MQRAIGEARGIKPIRSNRRSIGSTARAWPSETRRAARLVYRARVSQREWVVRTLEALLGDVPQRTPDLLLSAFVDLAERTGTEQLEELERLVRARRTRSGEHGS